MLVTLTTTHLPATDLGFLLHKNPARAQQVEVSTGTAHVFYPAATEQRCTEPQHLDRLRQRSLGRKRGLALREYALGQEGLERLARGEPLWRVHE
ncbi:PNKP adenylyltransferase domain-containing protein, C-terminal region [Geodermatophilus obscurus]|uniref:PNKP adenylyltransferase domain-containing protein, C-terminal region n=1 Tax=Geodermatophilus obscurus TaxID=1861 RepID=A0A1M7TLU0_9ACTN|nr:PNKP adenylyltransferase domain-containing protein, C-terminal region [Geodermatophilus obscurus]